MQGSTLSLQAPRPLGHARWCTSFVAVVLPGVLCLRERWLKSTYTHHTHVLYMVTGWGARAHLVPRGETLYFGVTYYTVFSCGENIPVG